MRAEAVSAASTASNLLYRSRVRTDPTNLTAPQWANAFWARLETMVVDLGEACIKVSGDGMLILLGSNRWVGLHARKGSRDAERHDDWTIFP